MKKGVWIGGAVVLVAGGAYLGLVARQGTWVETYCGTPVPVPGDLFEAVATVTKDGFFQKEVRVDLRSLGAAATERPVASWTGDVSLGFTPTVRLMLSDEDKREAGLSMKDETTVTFSALGEEKSMTVHFADLAVQGPTGRCTMADGRFTIDLEKSVANWKGAPLECGDGKGGVFLSVGEQSLVYDRWGDDPYVGRMVLKFEALSEPQAGLSVGSAMVESRVEKKPAPETKDGAGGVLATVGLYTSGGKVLLENVRAPEFQGETKSMSIALRSDNLSLRVLDVMTALSLQSALTANVPLAALGVLQEAFVKEGFTVDLDDFSWETSLGKAVLTGRLAYEAEAPDGKARLGAFAFRIDPELARSFGGASVDQWLASGLLREVDKQYATDFVLNTDSLTANGQPIF